MKKQNMLICAQIGLNEKFINLIVFFSSITELLTTVVPSNKLYLIEFERIPINYVRRTTAQFRLYCNLSIYFDRHYVAPSNA